MQGLKTVIVTGSNKGVGYGIVENLAAKGTFHIIMACRNVELAQTAKDELLKKFPNASLSLEKLDVSNEESIDQFVKVVGEKYKKVDVLVNNAGVAAKGDSFSTEVFDFTFNTVTDELCRISMAQSVSQRNSSSTSQIRAK